MGYTNEIRLIPFVFIAAHLAIMDGLICLLTERPRGNASMWSLTYSEICYCKIVFKAKRMSDCINADIAEADLWFVEDPQTLITPQSWTKEVLDGLLEHHRNCDNIAPVFDFCPTEVVQLQTDVGKSTANYEWVNPMANDNNGIPTITCSHASGTHFPIGETIVNCVAVDVAGNEETCQFSVLVSDTEAPTFASCPDVSSMTTSATAAVSYQNPTANDNSNVAPVVECEPISGSEFAIGKNNVTCIARDNSGNNDTCHFAVEIIDKGTPVFVVCPDVLAATARATAYVTFSNPSATDNSNDALAIECEPPSGSEFVIGKTIVACVARDTSGNNESCQFTVEVIDCQDQLGLEDGRITDSQVTASNEYPADSSWGGYHGSANARLNLLNNPNIHTGAWSAGVHDIHQWIQAEVDAKWVTGVMTQGRNGVNQWVTEYKVQYSNDGTSWTYVETGSNAMVFNGNSDRDTIVTGKFPRGIEATYIRILPTAWSNHISMRFELLGCYAESCSAGWPTINRASVDGGAGWTMVSPDKRILCNGTVTKWTYQAKNANQWRAIIFRPIQGSATQYQIVGINNISVAYVNKPAAYIVPESERIRVNTSDVIGWSAGLDSVIAFDRRGSTRVQYVGGDLSSSLNVGQTVNCPTTEFREYSIEVSVRIE